MPQADTRLRLLLDQNVPREVKAHLTGLRPAWTVEHTSDVGLAGATDTVIGSWALQRNAVVVTFDQDFADRRLFPPGTTAGVIRLRVYPTTAERAIEALSRVLASVADGALPGALVVVDNARVRLRRLSSP